MYIYAINHICRINKTLYKETRGFMTVEKWIFTRYLSRTAPVSYLDYFQLIINGMHRGTPQKSWHYE